MLNSIAILRASLLLLIALTMVGCSSYAIQGRVLAGSTASVQLVDKNDPRLKEDNPSGGGAVVQGVFEPNTPSDTKALGQVVTDGQGFFAIPVNKAGSGFLEYEALLIAQREGYQGAMNIVDLPRSGQRVLITLPRGRNTLKVPERFLDQTMREAQPYLEDNR